MLLSITYRIKIGESSAKEELNKTDKSKSGDAISRKGVGARLVFPLLFFIFMKVTNQDDESEIILRLIQLNKKFIFVEGWA